MKDIYSKENIKKVINSVQICKTVFITKDGKVFSPEAEELIESMKEFNIYLKSDKIDLWNNNIRKTVYNTFAHIPTLNDEEVVKQMLEKRNQEILLALTSYINAGKIMRIYDETKSWDKVYDIFQKRNVLSLSISLIMKEFSKYSEEFVRDCECDVLEYKNNTRTYLKVKK